MSRCKSKPPLDMLRECRAQFADYAKQHWAKATKAEAEPDQDKHARKARVNEAFVGKIDATLRDWA